jgi:SAM-dependent methyltransferase
MTAATGVRWATEPFVMASPEQFARLREWFIAARYSVADIEAKANAGLKSMYDLRQLQAREPLFVEPTDLQSFCVLFFLEGAAIPRATVDRLLSAEDRALLDTFGLLQASVADPSRCVAPLALYDVEGLYLASDRLVDVEVIGEGVPSDIVFSVVTGHSQQFIERMPRRPCDDYLELCSGAAPAALLAARDFAARSAAVDITERSTRFAEFNRRLNGIENAVMLQGDLFAPVEGRQFDVITAHPPYIPSFDNAMIFRDGGNDGEQVIRAIISALPRYLRPGGICYIVCMMTSRAQAPLEQRIRAMLGDAQSELDLLIGVAKSGTPPEMFTGSLRDGTSGPELFAKRMAAFEALGITEFVAGTFIFQRRTDARPVGTRRRRLTLETGWPALSWALDYMAATSAWNADNMEALLQARPRRLEGTQIEARSVFRAGQWIVSDANLVSAVPFNVKGPCLPWFPDLLAWCDGTVTVRELYQRVQTLRSFDHKGSEADFALLIYQLADAPFLELSDIGVAGGRL